MKNHNKAEDILANVPSLFDQVELLSYSSEWCLDDIPAILGADQFFKAKEKRKVTFRLGENEKKIDLVLMKKNTSCFCKM